MKIPDDITCRELAEVALHFAKVEERYPPWAYITEVNETGVGTPGTTSLHVTLSNGSSFFALVGRDLSIVQPGGEA